MVMVDGTVEWFAKWFYEALRDSDEYKGYVEEFISPSKSKQKKERGGRYLQFSIVLTGLYYRSSELVYSTCVSNI